jgi:hypothetical protein
MDLGVVTRRADANGESSLPGRNKPLSVRGAEATARFGAPRVSNTGWRGTRPRSLDLAVTVVLITGQVPRRTSD